ncbi:MAG: polyprenyl synthetase family protein [Nannocystis sp.]|nr:polyprenyl synthetase family protein [Nannocystis sp.]MBK9752010.1 polyprenyl synthetase family protein [Nannocystis sp.]
MSSAELSSYLEEVRGWTLAEIDRIIPRGTRHDDELYALMRDYPFREAKGLRPALCFAVCRALGGGHEAMMPTAAVFELYHNAFLIHDDVEDGSLLRRDRPTLHRQHGVPIAVNVGDAMLALCLGPLLDNTRTLGVGKALRLLELVARMARESAEGQAIELGWIRRGTWSLADRDYYRMVHKKTTWYSFLAPMLAGAIVAGATPQQQTRIRLLASLMGTAFQIQDDVLNLVAAERAYGKEIAGDLWEGKHTLMIVALMRSADEADRAAAAAVLRKRRPVDDGDTGPDVKTEEEVTRLRDHLFKYGCVDYARRRAQQRADRAARLFSVLRGALAPSVHRDFLAGLMQYLVTRNH